MKKIVIALLFMVTVLSSNIYSQHTKSNEKYGRTLNAGIGVGYYRYADKLMPVFHVNFEFDVARNFTLAPFISFYSYRNHYYNGNPHDNNKEYYYHETVIPAGVKGTYYFDEIFNANNDWDFYAAASLGFAIINSSWDNGYEDKDKYKGAGSFYSAIHIGTEYHFNNKVGAFLDLSSSVSTFGLAIHFK